MEYDEIRRAIRARQRVATVDWAIEPSDRDDMLPPVVEWVVNPSQPCRIIVGRRTYESDKLDYFAGRLSFTTPLIARVTALKATQSGTLKLSLDDNASVRGVAFCSDNAADILIPDPNFILSNGYSDLRAIAGTVPWQSRQKIAFWRGSPTGIWPNNDWHQIQRLALCRIGFANPDLIDAGITGVPPRMAAYKDEIEHEGLMRARVPNRDFARYAYQIDVDGNTNSWPGLFTKLLTGSPILKIASLRGFCQWYYDRLVPWRNFVPVEADMRDLMERVRWLETHDDEARTIGAASLDLALSLTYESEMSTSAQRVLAAVG